MEWVQIFESLGIQCAMLVYFVWNTQKRDKNMSEERAKRAEEFKAARDAHIAAEKAALVKYSELTEHVTAVIATVQQEINALTDKVAELAAIIRKEKD